MAVALIVERVSGVQFSKYAQENILDRLPFKSATYNSTWAKLSGHLADGFVQVKRNVSWGGFGWSKSVYEPTAFFIDSEREDILAGPGGVSMSARDAVSIPFEERWLLLMAEHRRRLGCRLCSLMGGIQALEIP